MVDRLLVSVALAHNVCVRGTLAQTISYCHRNLLMDCPYLPVRVWTQEIKSDATQMSPMGQWMLFSVTALVCLSIAQPDRFAKRLMTIVLGLTGLICLNEFVKVGEAFLFKSAAP